jgi:V/A-type H+-transporting ATPase subunit D
VIVFGRDVVPTRSVLLELENEARFVREGLDLLDQQRMLLAAELFVWIRRIEERAHELESEHARAVVALAEAVARHGPEELAVLPAERLAEEALSDRSRTFLGIALREARLETGAFAPPLPTPEAKRCALRFRRVLELEVELAALSGNVQRLLEKYRWTERRARALEHVIVPELDAAVREVAAALEEVDQEDAVRVRLVRGR